MKFKWIVSIVCNFYNIKEKDVLSPKRNKDIVKARQIISYIVREKFGISYPVIGRKLGGRNHATAIHSCNKIRKIINKDAILKEEIEKILNFISSFNNQKKREVLNKLNEDYFKNKKQKKDSLIVKSIKDFPTRNLSPEHFKRQYIILEKYKKGLTLEEIGKEYSLTRERIRQITEEGFINEAKNFVKKGMSLDLEEFLKKRRKEHIEVLMRRKGEALYSGKKNQIKKEKRWSRFYNSCRRCDTIIISHRSNGYCRKCYPKTEISKELQQASRLRNIKKNKINVT